MTITEYSNITLRVGSSDSRAEILYFTIEAECYDSDGNFDLYIEPYHAGFVAGLDLISRWSSSSCERVALEAYCYNEDDDGDCGTRALHWYIEGELDAFDDDDHFTSK